MDNKLIIAALLALGGGAIFFALSYPYMSGSARAQKRQTAFVRASNPDGRSKPADPAQRRKAIAETVKVLEAQSAGRTTDLSSRITQAGLSWSTSQFWIVVSISTAVACGASYWFTGDLLVALGVAVVAFFGLPRWLLSFFAARRVKKFLLAFPNAIDVIIRGVRAGLPVGDCFRMIANEATEPVRSEFQRIVDAQAVGLTIGEAVEKLADRIPIPETSFFAIVLNVQQKTGGNLSEALGNLAGVLRDRKRMKDKVDAISVEAKASAAIIGSLPFVNGVLVYFLNPDYIMQLFVTPMGNLIIAGALIWMVIGIFVMRAMINFDV